MRDARKRELDETKDLEELADLAESKALSGLVGREGITSRLEAIKTRAMLVEVTEGTTARHRIQPKAARVSWTQRLLSWFRRS